MVVGVPFEDAFRNSNDAVEIALVLAQQSEIDVHNKRKRVEAAGSIELCFGFREVAVRHEAQSVILMSAGVAGVELDRFLVFARSCRPVVVVMTGNHPERGVRFGERGIELQSFEGGVASAWQI